jgi:hypothetical protein
MDGLLLSRVEFEGLFHKVAPMSYIYLSFVHNMAGT